MPYGAVDTNSGSQEGGCAGGGFGGAVTLIYTDHYCIIDLKMDCVF